MSSAPTRRLSPPRRRRRPCWARGGTAREASSTTLPRELREWARGVGTARGPDPSTEEAGSRARMALADLVQISPPGVKFCPPSTGETSWCVSVCVCVCPSDQGGSVGRPPWREGWWRSGAMGAPRASRAGPARTCGKEEWPPDWAARASSRPGTVLVEWEG